MYVRSMCNTWCVLHTWGTFQSSCDDLKHFLTSMPFSFKDLMTSRVLASCFSVCLNMSQPLWWSICYLRMAQSDVQTRPCYDLIWWLFCKLLRGFILFILATIYNQNYFLDLTPSCQACPLLSLISLHSKLPSFRNCSNKHDAVRLP